MRFAVLFLAGMMALPTWAQGLRNLKVGDKLPAKESLSVFLTEDPKLILCLDSSKERNTAFVRELAPVLGKAEGVELFLVDINPEKGSEGIPAFDTAMPARHIPDLDRKIYGDLGIIVLPTLLFVTRDNVLHSVITGYRSNLNLVFLSHWEAFQKGEKPRDVAQSAAETMQERKTARYLEQGFRSLVSREFELALGSYRKALEIDPEDETAELGVGYSLMFLQRLDEGVEYFAVLKERGDSKRALLGYHLCRALTAPQEEDLTEVAALCLLEPRFFPVIFQAAKVLDKAGKCEESKKAFKHAYDVLLRAYKRNS